MSAPIEDVIAAGLRLLESERLAEGTRDVRGKAARRLQHFDAETWFYAHRECRRSEQHDDGAHRDLVSFRLKAEATN
ncbi:MAG: hypothetical protein DMF86_13540 [Acidobacteria bacterium]|nr:MAG: hypothetical protein DMF86_13540 [Acidobacteriota bacterium]